MSTILKHSHKDVFGIYFFSNDESKPRHFLLQSHIGKVINVTGAPNKELGRCEQEDSDHVQANNL